MIRWVLWCIQTRNRGGGYSANSVLLVGIVHESSSWHGADISKYWQNWFNAYYTPLRSNTTKGDNNELQLLECVTILAKSITPEKNKCDGDGAWIQMGLMRGTLRMLHDGSYMSKVRGSSPSHVTDKITNSKKRITPVPFGYWIRHMGTGQTK